MSSTSALVRQRKPYGGMQMEELLDGRTQLRSGGAFVDVVKPV